jgi:hypothetical protein
MLPGLLDALRAREYSAVPVGELLPPSAAG